MDREITFIDLIGINSANNLSLNEEQLSILKEQNEMLELIINLNKQIIKLIMEGILNAQEND